MTNRNQRLANCFTNAFPGIQPNEIPRASTASLAAWDSVAHITLLAAISEEFGVELASEDFEELVSFALIADFLANRGAHG
jgi:acyl carrier protein